LAEKKLYNIFQPITISYLIIPTF